MKLSFISTALATLLIAPSTAMAYTVQPGDSLWKIAQNHQVTVSRLMAANHLASTRIYPGQYIAIPGEHGSTTQSYTVVKGDSLWKISQRYHTSVQALVAANLLTSDLIYPGQTLLIPSGTTGGSSSPTGYSAPAPSAFRDGVFPLPKGSYQPSPTTSAMGARGTRTAPAPVLTKVSTSLLNLEHRSTQRKEAQLSIGDGVNTGVGA